MGGEGGMVGNKVGEISGDVFKTTWSSKEVINGVVETVKGFQIGVVLVALKLSAETGKA